jgi:hypothetical protein
MFTVVGSAVGLLSGVAQFLSSYVHSGLELLLTSGAVVAVGLVAALLVSRGWNRGRRKVTLSINLVVLIVAALVTLGVLGGWAGRKIGVHAFPEPTPTPAVTAAPARTIPASDSPAPTVSAPTPTASPIAQPAVRRGGQWTLMAYEAIDLDSMDSRWNATSDTWTTQDVAYYANDHGDGLNTLTERLAAALPLGTVGGYEACLRAPYGKPGTEPREDNVNPPHAICLTTSEGRYALIEIQSYQPNRLGVKITVWENS